MLEKKSVITIIAVVAVALMIVISATGCLSENVEVKITSAQSNDGKGADGLTSLERGKIRRQILSDSQAALDIWLKGDASRYDQAFSKYLLKEYQAQLAKLHERGLDKARIHEATHLEVTELTKNEAALTYTFIDKSYTFNTKTKKVTTPTKNAASEINVDVRKEDGRWKINAMIGKGEQTL